MVTIWGYLTEIKLPVMDTERFGRLAKVAKVVLTIPHSDAGEERNYPKDQARRQV